MAVALHNTLHFQPQESFQPQDNFQPQDHLRHSDRTRELVDADIDKRTFADADIDRRTLVDADLEGKVLSDADLGEKILTDADLEERYVNDLEKKLVADLEETPPEVQAELDERRRKLEEDNQALDLALETPPAGKQHHSRADLHLWLKGKSRQAMTNYNDVQYVAFMEVGNQTISGIIDTGSFELVVFSSVCETCGQAGRYNPAFSGFHRQGKLSTRQSYGSGDTFSQEAYDMVSIGPYAPRNQSFWEVTKAEMPVLTFSAFQSIIGVGPPETPLMDAAERLRATMGNVSEYTDAGMPVPSDLQKSLSDRRSVLKALEQKKTMLETFDTTYFSLCIGKRPNSPAYLIWSDTAPLVKPEYFVRVPVVGNHTWSVRIEAPFLTYNPDVSAVDKRFEGLSLGCETGCAALMDSGTSLLAMPGSAINEIVKITLEEDFNCTELWKLPSIKLRIGGHEIILPPDSYISEVAEDSTASASPNFVRWRNLNNERNLMGDRELRGSWTQRPGAHCDMMIMESPAVTTEGSLWILGVPFFRQFYTTFETAGRDNTRRALHIAKATETCHPAAPTENMTIPPRTELYKRLIDPTKLYVPPSVHSVLRSDYVSL